MASGHVNRTNRPNTWLHRPATRREDSPCQLGAVHTWHFATCCGAMQNRSQTGRSGHSASRDDRAEFMMGWTPRTASMCQSGVFEHHLREASVSGVITVGLDIAKHVFHAHGVDDQGRALFSKRISRGKLLDFFAAQPSCTVALEACGGAHHWAR